MSYWHENIHIHILKWKKNLIASVSLVTKTPFCVTSVFFQWKYIDAYGKYMYICYIWNRWFYIYLGKNDFFSNLFCVSIFWQAQSLLEGTKIGSLPSVSLIARGNRCMNTIMTHHAKGQNQAGCRIVLIIGMEEWQTWVSQEVFNKEPALAFEEERNFLLRSKNKEGAPSRGHSRYTSGKDNWGNRHRWGWVQSWSPLTYSYKLSAY